MTSDEQEIFDQIVYLKKEKELLYVIYEELDEILNLKYTSLQYSDETSGLFFAHNEYKKWKENANKT